MRRTTQGKLLAWLTIGILAWLGQAPQAAAQQQGKPGDFDYYALVLSWSPSYCADTGAGRGDPQCASNRPFAFVLHGLWPQYARGFPDSCRTAFNPFVPRPVIDGMLDIMPSPKLAIHEYRVVVRPWRGGHRFCGRHLPTDLTRAESRGQCQGRPDFQRIPPRVSRHGLTPPPGKFSSRVRGIALC